MRNFLDRWKVWAVVAWVVLALVVVWLYVLNGRLNTNVERTKRATRANTDAIAFLCETNAILEALAVQTIFLLQAEQLQHPTASRAVTISVFRGYAEVLRNRAPCVRAERVALR